ncbi:MAG: precorrin-4 C(11)-methyltransferase [Dialister sp.]|nr:precorrin-4 C(11)-methyltransferase [Dialister sp.]
MSHLYFIGAGPGDPELITLKGKRIISEADVIIYAGSLVNPEVLRFAKNDAAIYNSATMNLDEVLDVEIKALKEGKTVARVHTGDPAIYGAIQEQMDGLMKAGIKESDFEVVPGVSSFLASAAALKQEYTLPGISQTVIITRMEGRTPMPDKEKLHMLAAHQATMCIFLSVQAIDKVMDELKKGGYSGDTPVAIVVRATWPDQKILRGTIDTIADVLKKEGVLRQAMIVVGKVLDTEYELSKLYDSKFTTMFREGTDSK